MFNSQPKAYRASLLILMVGTPAADCYTRRLGEVVQSAEGIPGLHCFVLVAGTPAADCLTRRLGEAVQLDRRFRTWRLKDANTSRMPHLMIPQCLHVVPAATLLTYQLFALSMKVDWAQIRCS